MALEYINKDILQAFREGEFNVLLHQTNCVTKDRVSGIAKSIFDEYPGALEAHLDDCKFSDYSLFSDKKKIIINCNSQYFQGACSNLIFTHPIVGYEMFDNFNNRLLALKHILFMLTCNIIDEDIVGIPLIASGVGADKSLKGSMRDLEYFQKFIAPTVEKYLPNCKVYYL